MNPTMHVRHLRRGKAAHEGTGLSFFFRPLSAVLSEVPVDDRELPLLFHARTADFQDLAVQASVTFRLTDPAIAGTRIDFSIDPDTGRWRGTPLEQVGGLLTETAQQQVLGLIASRPLASVLADGVEQIRDRILHGLTADSRLAETGIAVIGARVIALEELLARHGTRGQSAFYLRSRGRRIEDLEARHREQAAATAEVSSGIPPDWRRGMVERADLPRFLFSPEDIVVAVGQDGLVANLAKYLDGQLVIGVNPEPRRNPGVLVRHEPRTCTGLLALAARAGGGPGAPGERLTMVTAETDDGQQLTGLNEIYLGQPTHQTARYTLRLPDGRAEAQASSGLIVSTGTGATGWCRSAWLERKSSLVLPSPEEARLAWFVREAWPSPTSGTACTEGTLSAGQEIAVSAESDRLVLFGDGIESDAIPLTWGQTARLRVAGRSLRLL
jgi:hypothetical protein